METQNTPSYPAMSHPSADPAVNAVAARLVGHRAGDPSQARTLELGCASGHHLLPLAARWPEAEIVGIDADARAIALARELAAEAGLANATFHAGPFESLALEGDFHFIIAHGVFSWVADAVKLALFQRIATLLSQDGVAVVSFNVAAGWQARMPVAAKARAVQAAGGGPGEVSLTRALEILRDVCEADAERSIVDDMLAKGEAVLAHDDFAPVNDAFSLADFVALAAHHGLRWLGESVPGVLQSMEGADAAGDPAAIQDALDRATGRTFRSALLCRADAVIAPRVPASVVEPFFLCAKAGACGGDAALMGELAAAAPHDAHAGEMISRHGPAMATRIVRGILVGDVAARTHPAHARVAVPGAPRMDELRLACARRGLPVVDARHRPCVYPPAHLEILAMMDGTRTLAELAEIAHLRAADLDFPRWMLHLAQRGFLL